jgi:hypothetical protein
MKKFAIANINPSKNELWQIHKSGCADLAPQKRFKRCIESIYEVQAVSPQVAEDEWLDAEMRGMGYQPGDGSVRIMPCCKDAAEAPVVDVLAPECQWFLQCHEPAVRSVKHPALGDVPCCEKHAKFAEGK